MNTSNIYQKHLSLSKRIRIEQLLNEGKTIKEIAENISKSKNTVYYEIKNHRQMIKCNRFNAGSKFNPNCPNTKKLSFVCNSCPSRKGCRKNRYLYIAEEANNEYVDKLSTSRIGINMDPEEFNNLKNIVRDGIKNGLSFSMILNSNKDINLSKRTLYNYQNNEYFGLYHDELPRKVRYKVRKKKSESTPKNNKYRINRTYQDFIEFKQDFFVENKYDVEVVEMDTVEGVKGTDEAVLLTLLFTSSNFLMAFKMEHKTSECVCKVFDYLKDTLGIDMYIKLFQCILTDNGSEFSNPDYIEDNGIYLPKTHVFYCDPNRSDQKGKIEVCHEFIRRFIPKGTSFNSYSQDDITNMINHINSVPRDLFKGQCAYSIQSLYTYNEFFDLLGYKYISYPNICLNKKIFKK